MTRHSDIPSVARSGPAKAAKTWHLLWRIARPGRRSPFRWVVQPVSVAERDVTVSGTTLRIREYQPHTWAATILLNGGFVAESIDDARLINFATALAEIGFLVVTPDYPAVRELEFDPKTIDQIAGMIDQLVQQGERTALAVVGLSYMGTLSLKAALRSELASPPELVAVLGGYADFGDLMHDVFRDVYRTEGVEVPVDPYGRFLVLRSAIGYLDAPPEERERIREIALAIGRQLDPAEIEGAIRTLSPGGVACVEALRRFHPDRQSEQWRRIVGGSRELIEALSVTESPERLRSRLMILHSVYDHILPCSGSLALHRRFPAADLVLTTLFTHVNVRVSPRALWTQVRELRALFRMLGGIIALQG